MGAVARRIAAALIIAAAAAVPRISYAQAPRRIVLVVARAVDDARQQAALDAVRAQLGDLPVETIVERPEQVPPGLRDRLDLAAQAAKTHGALGAFVLELDRANDLLVYLVEPEARRALVRRIESPSSEAAGFEELSLIVRSTSSALLEGREIGMEQGPELAARPAPPQPEPAPKRALPEQRPPSKARVKPARSETTGRLEAFYVGEDYAPEARWLSGLGLRLSFSPDARLFFGLGYALQQPLDVDTGAAAARVTRYPAELFAAYELPIDRVALGAALGARSDVVTRETVRTDPGIEPTSDDSQLLWGLAGRAVVRWMLSDRVALGAALGAELFFNDSDYVVDVAGEQEPVLRPRSLRPRAEAGVAVDLW